MTTTPTTFGSTLLVIDWEWNDKTGTHLNRPVIFITDNEDGTIKVMRASTKQAKRNKPPRQADRRVRPDGAGQGNSFERPCDLVGGKHGIIDIPTHLVIRKLGDLSKADAWWVEDQLFA